MKKGLFVLILTISFLFFFGAELIGQTQKKANEQIDLKNPIAEFNLKRTHLTPNNFQDLIIENLNTDSDLGVILNYLDKLDDKIVKLVYLQSLKRLKVFYGNNFTVLDVMQGLKSIGYPAYYITDNGDHAVINSYGAIEFIQMKK